MQGGKFNTTNRSVEFAESLKVAQILQAKFVRFSLFYKCEARRKIIEKPYAAEKKGRDEQERSFFVVANYTCFASNICSFFIILQVRSTQENNRKSLCRENSPVR